MPSFRSGAAIGLLAFVLLAIHTKMFTSIYFERKGHPHLRDQVVKRARALRPVAFVTHHAPRLFAHSLLPRINHQKRLSLAIVRTISIRDGSALTQSFDQWAEHPLGEKCTAAGYYDIDLIISFSREFDRAAYPKISAAIETTRDIFEKTGGWGGCIRSLKTFEAKISPEEDLYDSTLVELGDSNWRQWVNGPNRQFERTFRHIQSLAKYDAMFLMEADTFPIADNWLDNLVEEIEASSPFALLGSKYNGNAWDEFADKMPLALLHHLNGNSVYNTSHPLIDHILCELEEEASTEYNAISYDYRISQMLLEGSSGLPPEFPYDNIFDDDGKAIVLAPKSKFAAWWKQYSDDDPIQESSVISNIASTSYLQDEVDTSVSIVHGKNVYLPWNEDDYGSVSLVVSGFGAIDDPYKDFLSQIDSIHHPFSEIVVIMGSESSDDDLNFLRQWAQSTTNIKVIVQRRNDAPNMDLCTAEVSTDYFMITSVNFAPLESIQLMFAADGTNRPVVSFVSSASAHCSSFKVCADTLGQARVFFPDMDRYFLSDDILYHEHLRRQFCDNLSRRRESGSLTLRGETAGTNIPGPSATNYMAFLYSSGIVRSTYIQSNAVVHGSRKLFVETEPKTPASLQHHLSDVGNSSGSPLFWKIPRSGGTMVQTLCAYCLDLTIAASTPSGTSTDSNKLRIANISNEKYAGVDLSTVAGVERAGKLGLIESEIADVVITPLLNVAAKNLFTSEANHRASAFALFRDPVERATSLFFHLQDLSKKGKYDPDFQNMTIEEYTTSNIAENNWMVRMLNDEPSVVDERHLEVAKGVLRRKFVVGLTSKMQESMKRFYSYFGWDLHDGWSPCEFSLLFGDRLNHNAHSTPKKQGGVWNLLVAKNSLDIKLYEYAVDLFHSQGQELFEPNSSVSVQLQVQTPRPQESAQPEETLRDILDLSLQRRMNDYPGDSTHTTPTCPEDKGSCCTTDDLPELEVDYVQTTSAYTIILNGVEGEVGEPFEVTVADAIYEYWAEVDDAGVVSVCVDVTQQTSQGRNRKLADTVLVQYETTTILDPTTSNIEIDADNKCSDCDFLGEAPFSTPQLLNNFVEELKVKNVVSASEGSVSEPIFDSDGDGLGNEKEGTIGTDPDKPDTDFDGLTDKQEFDAGTNPLAPDSDLDGITDGQEAILGTNPLLKDTDKDGIADGQEFTQGTDPLAVDSDLDGLADGQEAILGTNPVLNDTDKDGIADGQEVAQGTNPLAPDSDLDGITDGQEASLNTNPLFKDTDKDGLADGQEVTLGTNPLLKDTDKDGIADGQEVAQGTDPLTVTCSGRDRGTCFGLTSCQWCEIKLECLESTKFLADCRASTCPDIKSLSFCTSHALCAWKDNACVSNIFGGGRNNNNKKGCMRLDTRRQAIKCLKKKRRKCNKKRNTRKRNQCLRKVTKKIRQVKKNFRSRFLRESSSNRRPKMYTFYHHVQTESSEVTDLALLELWKKEWTRAGFDAQVLTLDSAKAHPKFSSYQKTLHENTTLHTPLEYNYMCFYRWLAMAAIGGGFMSDYDVLPIQGSYVIGSGADLPNGGKFTTYERHVPSMLAGSGKEWERLAHIILRVAVGQSKGLIPIAEWTGTASKTSDMLAFLHVIEGGMDVAVTPDAVLGNPQDYKGFEEDICLELHRRPAVHFSHFAIDTLMGSKGHMNERHEIMKDWISHWREVCVTSNGYSEESRRQQYKSDSTMTISRENKLVYVHTPKTGGTTMERSALFADARAHHQIGGHYDISTMMANAQARGISDFLRVTHIRHPCSRFVSAFSYLKSDKCNAGDKAWSESHIGNLTIEEFAGKIRGNEELLDEVHFRPLHQWVFMPGGLFGLDAILCQETWNASIDELSARLQIPPPVDLYSSHALQNSHQSCSQLDENTRLNIEKAYDADYCIFGFDKMPSSSCPQSGLTPSYLTDRYAQCVKRTQATRINYGQGGNAKEKPRTPDQFDIHSLNSSETMVREIWVVNQPKCGTGSLVKTLIGRENKCNREDLGINEQIIMYRCPKHTKVFRTHNAAKASEYRESNHFSHTQEQSCFVVSAIRDPRASIPSLFFEQNKERFCDGGQNYTEILTEYDYWLRNKVDPTLQMRTTFEVTKAFGLHDFGAVLERMRNSGFAAFEGSFNFDSPWNGCKLLLVQLDYEKNNENISQGFSALLGENVAADQNPGRDGLCPQAKTNYQMVKDFVIGEDIMAKLTKDSPELRHGFNYYRKARVGGDHIAMATTPPKIAEGQPPNDTLAASPTQESQSSRWTDPRTIEEKGTPSVFLPRIFFDHDG